MTERPGLLRSAGVISAAVAVSRVTGFLRETVLSWLFGAGATFDAYVLGYRIPNLARDLFAEGALASAFVPTFSRYLATRTHEETRELSDVTGTVLIVVAGSLCALGMIFSPAFVNLFASGFHAVPGKFELAVQLVRIMFPFLLLIALAAQAQGILNACHRFGIPALSSSLFNVFSIVFGLAIGHWTSIRRGAGHGFRRGLRRICPARVPTAERLASRLRLAAPLEPAPRGHSPHPAVLWDRRFSPARRYRSTFW